MLSITPPYHIRLKITRQDDPRGQPAIFEWSPYTSGFTPSGFLLLHHTENGLEPVEVDHSGLVPTSKDNPLKVDGKSKFLWEIRPGQSVELLVTLPEAYQKLLEPGQRYTLLWPGGRIAAWDWGTISEHIDHELTQKSRPLLLPGGAHISFIARAQLKPWPPRAELEAQIELTLADLEEQRRRRSQTLPFMPRHENLAELDPRAPKLRIALDCSPTLRHNVLFDITVKVTYDADLSARPITFHTHVFKGSEHFRLYRLHEGNWIAWNKEHEEGAGFILPAVDDVSVHVSEDKDFVSLQPGHSWTASRRLQSEIWPLLLEDMEDGQAFRYVFSGAALDWWDWGTKEEHQDTVVWLPGGLAGSVVEPADNNGRMKLVVAASEPVEFTLTGKSSD